MFKIGDIITNRSNLKYYEILFVTTKNYILKDAECNHESLVEINFCNDDYHLVPDSKFKLNDIIVSPDKKVFKIAQFLDTTCILSDMLQPGYISIFVSELQNYTLFTPKFKVGDRISTKGCDFAYRVRSIINKRYNLIDCDVCVETQCSIYDNSYYLVKKKEYQWLFKTCSGNNYSISSPHYVSEDEFRDEFKNSGITYCTPYYPSSRYRIIE